MKHIKQMLINMTNTVNFDGLRCMIKGDCSTREIIGALKREQEIREYEKAAARSQNKRNEPTMT